MSVSYCVLCREEHDDTHWRNGKWNTEQGEISGWGCSKWYRPAPLPEFIPQRIKDERPKYLKSMIQSHRGGELSKEWVESYPDRAKGMVKDGIITQKEVDKAKPVWKDLPNINNLHKTL